MPVDVNEVSGFILASSNPGYLLQLNELLRARLVTIGVPESLVAASAIPPTSFRTPIELDYARLAGGDVKFVQSTHASALDAVGYGATPEAPYATLDYAIGQCTASKGDAIIVLPGHAETVVAANGIDLDVAGITVIGLGNGSNRPTVTLGTLTSATVRINADNVTVRGIRFLTDIDSLVKILNVNGDNATIEDCEFIGQSTKEFLSGVNITTTKDGTTIRRCKFIQPTDPGGSNAAVDTGAVYLVDSENVLLEDCEFRGCFETACLHNKTTAAANLWLRSCYGQGSALTADSIPFLLVSGATGGIDRCAFNNPNEAATTEATLSGTFGAGFFNHQSFFGNDGGGGQLAIASQAAAT